MTPPSLGAIIAFALTALLLACSAFVSASETAFFSLSPSDRKMITDSEASFDHIITRLLEQSERLLATILISNNLINVTIILLSNFALMDVFHFGASWLEFLCITVLLTFALLLFGEIMPKLYSTSHSLRFARFAAPGILALTKVFWPLASLLARSTALADMLPARQDNLSVDDLEQALELTDKRELTAEQNILEGIIRFGDETVKDVMTSRLDMMGLDVTDNYTSVLKMIAENVYSRIPVYEETIDNICGILYIKDLLCHLSDSADFEWKKLIRKPMFVPENKPIDDLFREFQRDKCHIAIVVDEYGGTLGMVTMEDILEEIVGEINDEYDDNEKGYTRMNSNTYIFEAKTLLSDVCKVLDIDDDTFDEASGDADSLGGLLLELKGDFPQQNETIDYRNFTFEVLELDARRIVKVKVVIHPV